MFIKCGGLEDDSALEHNASRTLCPLKNITVISLYRKGCDFFFLSTFQIEITYVVPERLTTQMRPTLTFLPADKGKWWVLLREEILDLWASGSCSNVTARWQGQSISNTKATAQRQLMLWLISVAFKHYTSQKMDKLKQKTDMNCTSVSNTDLQKPFGVGRFASLQHASSFLSKQCWV